MKRILFLTLFLAGVSAAKAQFALDQCIDYALKNAVESKNALLDEEIAKAKVKETVGIGLPQVSGSFGVQHNNQLPRFFTQYDPNGGFIDLSGVPGIQPGDVVAAENFFQLKSLGDARLTVNQILFNGSYLVGLQASNAYKDLSVKSRQQTEEELVYKVTKAYFTVLINKERKLIFESNIARLDSLLRTTAAMYQAGFAEKIDVDRIKVSLNNLKAEYANFQNMDMLALYLLKFQMNFPFNEPLDVAGSISDQLPSTATAPDLAAWDYSMRPEYRVLLANQKLQQLNIRNQYAEGMPSLVAFANMGYNTQSPNVAGIFRTESNIANENGLGSDKWYGYSLFGIGLSWNMFTGLSRNYRIQQEKLTLMKLENGFQALERGIDLERLQAQAAMENAQKNLEVQAENIQLATDIVTVTRKKYEVGVGSNIELINAENSLREAQVNYYEALYNTLIAKTDLLRSLGILQNSK